MKRPDDAASDSHPRRRWLALAARVGRLALSQVEQTADLVTQSYDRVARTYDEAWTAGMRHLTVAMLDRLDPPRGAACLDLGCGTGFVTSQLALRTGREAFGVDASLGMLEVARKLHGRCCRFVWSDAVGCLRALPRGSFDVVTCAWALGYTRPLAVLRQVARVLRRGGRVGIVDNTLRSLGGVLWAACRTFAERPEALRHVMKVRFLPRASVLAAMVRALGLRVRWTADGAETYYCPTGEAVIDRLRATGAAAGFEFAANDGDRDAIFARFAEVMEDLYACSEGVPVTHRWLACIGERP
jgi:ubiquinone/menaquinone biosynthesis C-methylase UbiE